MRDLGENHAAVTGEPAAPKRCTAGSGRRPLEKDPHSGNLASGLPVLKHGKSPEVAFRMVLGTDRGTDLVVIEVDDGSPGRPTVHEADSDQESGRGMFLVAATATSWGVSADETMTWCTLASPAVARRGR